MCWPSLSVCCELTNDSIELELISTDGMCIMTSSGDNLRNRRGAAYATLAMEMYPCMHIWLLLTASSRFHSY